MIFMLLDVLRKNDKKDLFGNSYPFANYTTGFIGLDFLNAQVIPWKDKDGNKHSTIVKGLIGGRFITIVGYSGTGKTTIADQIGWSICNDYPIGDEEAKKKFEENALLIHVDVEKTALRQRILEITGADEEKDGHRIILNPNNAYIEDVLAMIDAICKAKESGGDEYRYYVDGAMFGSDKPVAIYVPTVFIIDSLKVFTSNSVNDAELEGQMSTNREVQQIAQFYNKCLSRMTKYNITIIATNHITTKIKINMYEPDKPQLMLLKDGEYLPRGQAPIYLATYLFRLNSSGAKTNMYTMEEHGFSGHRTVLQVTKTKTNYIGGKITLAFNSATGYDPVYTMYEFAVDNGLVEGRNPYLYIKGAEAYKFSRKNFREKYINEVEFQKAVWEALEPYYANLITTMSNTEINIDQNKLFRIDAEGNYVPTGIVETADGELKLKAD